MKKFWKNNFIVGCLALPVALVCLTVFAVNNIGKSPEQSVGCNNCFKLCPDDLLWIEDFWYFFSMIECPDTPTDAIWAFDVAAPTGCNGYYNCNLSA